MNIIRLKPGVTGSDLMPKANPSRPAEAGRHGGLMRNKRCSLCGQAGHRRQTCWKRKREAAADGTQP